MSTHHSTATCQVCGRDFRYDAGATTRPKPPPDVCGMLGCRARQHWGPGNWAGRARMADARSRAGIHLDDLDNEALQRTRSPRPAGTGRAA